MILRFGAVLGPKGGALAQMLLPFKLGLGGVLGSGNQYFSWISLHDLVRAIRFCIERESCSGRFNATSPFPVTNHKFTRTLGSILFRPTYLPVPAFALRMVLGQMADELLLASARVIPEKLLEQGFTFDEAELDTALQNALKR